MDPNLFAIDGERLFEVLMAIVVLSFLVERALAVFFESEWAVDRLAQKGVKELITFAVAVGVCRHWDFDAISVLFVRERTELWGHLITAGVVAGGSKASIKLFHDVFGVMSKAERERQEIRKATTKAKVDLAVASVRGAR